MGFAQSLSNGFDCLFFDRSQPEGLPGCLLKLGANFTGGISKRFPPNLDRQLLGIVSDESGALIDQLANF